MYICGKKKDMSQQEMDAIYDDMMANSEVGKLFHHSEHVNLKWLCFELYRRVEQEKERRSTLLAKIELMESEHGGVSTTGNIIDLRNDPGIPFKKTK
jgi:hypothetical protein